MVRSLVGPRIRERRRARKLSQAALAKEVGISASYLNLIEHNKRGIAGKTLIDIARRLEIEPEALSDEADAALVEALADAASRIETGAERARVGEMVGRFPGWARLLAALARRVESQRQSLDALSDRLTHDPYLSESMHLMLSSVTAVQATTAILSEAEDLTAAERARFLGNVHAEATRLARTAQEMAAYFDRPSAAGEESEEAGGLDAFWRERAHFVEELEADPGAADALADGLAGRRAADRDAAAAALARYAGVAARLPAARFAPAAAALDYDPLALAARFEAELDDVIFRLAHLPPGAPPVGMIECDGAGGVLFRKDIPGFPLPRQAGACPLWPLYRALGAPGQPVRAVMETPDGDRFAAFAFARPAGPAAYGAPPPLRAAMVFTGDAGVVAKTRPVSPLLPVGPHCGVCPRADCAARRAMFILG